MTQSLDPFGLVELSRLARQLILGRTDELGAREVAAFMAGWGSVLELLEASAQRMPDDHEERARARAWIAELKKAQSAAFEV